MILPEGEPTIAPVVDKEPEAIAPLRLSHQSQIRCCPGFDIDLIEMAAVTFHVCLGKRHNKDVELLVPSVHVDGGVDRIALVDNAKIPERARR